MLWEVELRVCTRREPALACRPLHFDGLGKQGREEPMVRHEGRSTLQPLARAPSRCVRESFCIPDKRNSMAVVHADPFLLAGKPGVAGFTLVQSTG